MIAPASEGVGFVVVHHCVFLLSRLANRRLLPPMIRWPLLDCDGAGTLLQQIY